MPSNIQNERLYYIFDRGDKQLKLDNRQLLREKYEMGRAVRKMRESRDRWKWVSVLILLAWISTNIGRVVPYYLELLF